MFRRYGLTIILGILGTLSLFGSFYIKGQVEAGVKQLSQAESGMNFGKKLFSLTPESEEIGDKLSGPIAHKVAEGKEQIAFYSNLADWLEIGGVLCIVVAIVSFILKKKK